MGFSIGLLPCLDCNEASGCTFVLLNFSGATDLLPLLFLVPQLYLDLAYPEKLLNCLEKAIQIDSR